MARPRVFERIIRFVQDLLCSLKKITHTHANAGFRQLQHAGRLSKFDLQVRTVSRSAARTPCPDRWTGQSENKLPGIFQTSQGSPAQKKVNRSIPPKESLSVHLRLDLQGVIPLCPGSSGLSEPLERRTPMQAAFLRTSRQPESQVIIAATAFEHLVWPTDKRSRLSFSPSSYSPGLSIPFPSKLVDKLTCRYYDCPLTSRCLHNPLHRINCTCHQNLISVTKSFGVAICKWNFLSLVLKLPPRSIAVSGLPQHVSVQDLLLAGHSYSQAHSLLSPLSHTAKCWCSSGLRHGPHSFLPSIRSPEVKLHRPVVYTPPLDSYPPLFLPSWLHPWAPSSLRRPPISLITPLGRIPGLSGWPQITQWVNGWGKTWTWAGLISGPAFLTTPGPESKWMDINWLREEVCPP